MNMQSSFPDQRMVRSREVLLQNDLRNFEMGKLRFHLAYVYLMDGTFLNAEIIKMSLAPLA